MEEANWVSTDRQEETYYYNLVTEESSWELPSVCGKHAAEHEMEQNNAKMDILVNLLVIVMLSFSMSRARLLVL